MPSTRRTTFALAAIASAIFASSATAEISPEDDLSTPEQNENSQVATADNVDPCDFYFGQAYGKTPDHFSVWVFGACLIANEPLQNNFAANSEEWMEAHYKSLRRQRLAKVLEEYKAYEVNYMTQVATDLTRGPRNNLSLSEAGRFLIMREMGVFAAMSYIYMED